MTLTPVIPMAEETGFGTSTETTMTTASAAKSKAVETQKANQVLEETKTPTAPTAAEDVARETTCGWVSTFAEKRAAKLAEMILCKIEAAKMHEMLYCKIEAAKLPELLYCKIEAAKVLEMLYSKIEAAKLPEMILWKIEAVKF
jgi:hypothetical protein